MNNRDETGQPAYMLDTCRVATCVRTFISKEDEHSCGMTSAACFPSLTEPNVNLL